MRKKGVAWRIGLGLSIISGVIAIGGCKSSDDRRLSRKGEACQTTDDCTSGLSCVPLPNGSENVCVTGEFNVSTTAKECILEECQAPIDCCPTLSVSEQQACAQYQALCADGGPLSSDCEIYQQDCVCDTAKIACDDGRCRGLCTDDIDCPGGKCSGGKCVGCVLDTDCAPGDTCVSGVCTPPCQSDGDCPLFERCNAGKCVDSGCQTDRECLAATRNVESTCGTDGKCIIPCQTDLECGNPKAYDFYSCINSQCTYVGCQTDKDCELYFISGGVNALDAGYSVFGDKTHAVCRDKATTNGGTAPAN